MDYRARLVNSIASLRESLLTEVWRSVEWAKFSPIVQGDLTVPHDANPASDKRARTCSRCRDGRGPGFKAPHKPERGAASHTADHGSTRGKRPGPPGGRTAAVVETPRLSGRGPGRSRPSSPRYRAASLGPRVHLREAQPPRGNHAGGHGPSVMAPHDVAVARWVAAGSTHHLHIEAAGGGLRLGNTRSRSLRRVVDTT